MHINSQKGMTLPELLIAISISSLLGLGVAVFVSQQNKNVNELTYSINMQTLYSEIQNVSQKSQAILTSVMLSAASGNKLLKDCLTYPSVADKNNEKYTKQTCQITHSSEQKSFDLYRPQDVSSLAGDALKKLRIAGTEDNPVRYSLRGGAPCLNDNDDCPIEARAYFWATCPSNIKSTDITDTNKSYTSTNCPTAESIHVRIQVRHNQAISERLGKKVKLTQPLPPVPRDELFWEKINQLGTSFAATTISVDSIDTKPLYRVSCLPNYTVTSIVDGKATCECLYPYRELQSALTKVCILSQKTCPLEKRFRGFDDKGDPICEDVYCQTKMLSEGCGIGGWIEEINPKPFVETGDASASYSCRPKKNCNDSFFEPGEALNTCQLEVECQMEIKCCYEAKPL